MQAGDISNEVAPRYVFVFEGLVGVLPDPVVQRKHSLYVKARAWKRAARSWQFDPWIEKRMWDWAVRRSHSLDIVTYLPEHEADEVKERVDERGLPFGNFIVTTLEEFLHGYMLNPAVVGVFDADPRHALTYGGKGLPVGLL